MVSSLSVAGSEGPGAGVADVMDGDAEGWDPVAGGVVFWTGNGGSVAVVVTCWIGGVGSDGVCCGGCVTGGKAEYGCQTPWGMAHCGSVDG